VREAPALNRIQGEYKARGVTVVAVNIFPAAGLDHWTQYWKSVGGGDVVYAQDTRREAIRALQVRFAGATVVIDRQGREVWRDNSATDYETLKAAVERALQ